MKINYQLNNEMTSNDKFKNVIDDENWDPVFDTEDANERCNEFSKIYTAHYNNSCLLKKNRARRKNKRKNPKPWILPWLEDTCARENNLYFISIKLHTTAYISSYKKMNKFCEKRKKIAYDKYHKKYLVTYKDYNGV